MDNSLPSPFAAPAPPPGPMIPPAAPMPMPMPMPAPGANGIPGATGMPVPPAAMQNPDPSSVQWGTHTQQDGTVLLYMMNPDGSPGPVMHVWKPPILGGGKK